MCNVRHVRREKNNLNMGVATGEAAKGDLCFRINLEETYILLSSISLPSGLHWLLF